VEDFVLNKSIEKMNSLGKSFPRACRS